MACRHFLHKKDSVRSTVYGRSRYVRGMGGLQDVQERTKFKLTSPCVKCILPTPVISSHFHLATLVHNVQMLRVRKKSELGLVWGIFVIGAIFFAAAFATMWVLFLIGWNPLERPAYAYADSAISLIVGAISVLRIFRWARRPNGSQLRVNE